jgi:hypothetical protein
MTLDAQGEEPHSYSYINELPADDPTVRADARALLRKEMNALNTIPALLAENLPQNDKDEIQRSLQRVKLLLMQPAWGEPDERFGEFSTFERWVAQGEPDPPPVGMEGALALYRYGTP